MSNQEEKQKGETNNAAAEQQEPPRRSIEEIKAEARRHALSSATTSSKKRAPLWQQQQQQHAAAVAKRTKTGGPAVTGYPPLYPYPPIMPPPPHATGGGGGGDDKNNSNKTAAGTGGGGGGAGEYPPPYPYPPYPYHYPPGYPPYPPPPPPPPPATTAVGQQQQKEEAPPPNSQAAAAAAAAAYHAWHQQAYAAAAAAAAAYRHTTAAAATTTTTTSTTNNSKHGAAVLTTPPPTPPLTAAVLLQDPNVDDYTKFVKAMQIQDWDKLFEDDNEEEDDYQMDDEDDDDDDEEEDEKEEDGNQDNMEQQEQDGKPAAVPETNKAAATTTEGSVTEQQQEPDMDLTPLDYLGADDDDSSVFYKELREELGWLEEEDMEAAVATLLQDTTTAVSSQPPQPAPQVTQTTAREDHHVRAPYAYPYGPPIAPAPMPETPLPEPTTGPLGGPRTPVRHHGKSGMGTSSKTQLTADQYNRLVDLMKKHYQLLVQQSVLAIRAAHAQKYQNRILSRVAATVQLDDSDEAKKTKYGSAFWMGHESGDEIVECLDGAIGMLQDLNENRKDAFRHFVQTSQDGPRRLTRAQFQNSLRELSQGAARTVFDIPGISNLSDTFTLIDKSVMADENETEEHFLLETESVQDACKFVLDRAKVKYDPRIVPGARDLSFNFSDPREYCGDDFKPPCSAQQDLLFRRNRNLFSAGEDNLVLRGVNLYGEKQWMLIADRFLPERSIHIISQRYSKLCMMIYMANGVKIDEKGQLEKPPQVVEILSHRQKSFLENLKTLEPPAILNVHRWSLKEDLMLLKAVPILGNSWAKLGTYLIPYRDRGHLRKRYQVLERRVKSTMQRANRKEHLEVLSVRPSTKSRSPPSKPIGGPGQVSSPSKTRTSGTFATPQRRPPLSSASPHPHHSPYAYPPPPYSQYVYPYPPPLYSPGYMYPPPLPPHADETSRAAFEKLAQESKGEWSQFSYMQNIMSPHRPAHTGQTKGEGGEEKKSSGSLLGNVLRKADNGDGKKEQPPGASVAKSTVYSTNGSPIGLSDTFRNLPDTQQEDYMDSHIHGFGSHTMQSFPATSRLSTADGSSESQPSQRAGDGTNGFPETSMDSLSSTYSSAYTRVRTARPLFADGSSLLETDLEAASALNILSNSPGLKKRKTVDRGEEKEEEENNRAKPKSLFASVVGGGGGGGSKKKRSGSKKQRKA